MPILALLTCSAPAYCAPSGSTRNRLEQSFSSYEHSGLYRLNYDSARIFLLKLIRAGEKAECWDFCLKALSELAYISDQNYQFQVQREAVEQGQHILRQHASFLDSVDRQYALRSDMVIMTGLFYRNNGELDRAVRVFQELIQRLTSYRTVDRRSVYYAYTYLADLYMKMGLYGKVYEYYLLAGNSIPEGEEHSFHSYIHDLYLGSYFYRIKNFATAKAYYLEALEKTRGHADEEGWRGYIISNYNILALIYQESGRRDSALFCLKKALSMHRPDDPDLLETYEYMADCFFEFNDLKGALDYYERTYSGIRKGHSFNIYKKAQLLAKIGDVHQHMQRYHEALTCYQHAFSLLYSDSSYLRDPLKNPGWEAIQADKTIIRLLIQKSNVLFEQASKTGNLNQLMQSLGSYRLTTQVIDEFRHKISTDDFKELFVTDIRAMYENAVKASYLAYKMAGKDTLIEMAFYFMGKSKNQVLLDAIMANQARKYSNIPASVLVLENQYKNKMVELQNTLYRLKFSDADPGLTKNCQFEYASTQNKYEEFLDEMERVYPDYYNLKYNRKIPAIREIQPVISKELVIEYMVGEDFIGLIAFSSRKAFFRLIPFDSLFHRHLSGILRDLGDSYTEDRFSPKAFQDFTDRAKYLHSILLEPVLSEFNQAERIVIIPDGRLCFLPFEVLISKYPEDRDEVNYRDLAYVLKTHAIRYEFSASLLGGDKQRTGKSGSRNTYYGFAPAYFQENGLRKVDVLGKETSAYLTPLVFSIEEIEAAAAVFNGTAFTGDQANVKTFRKSIASSRIIHFAGHTLINDSIPQLSGIFFSSRIGDQVGQNENEVIYSNEIFNLDMEAGLIILSACETGKGKLLKGEGLISIGRAFKYAGCPNLIMSLWKINDRSASEIMQSFCRNLKRGRSLDIALQHAKLEYLKNTKIYNHTHPFYWSAFIMIGNKEPLFRSNLWPLLAGILFVALILVFLIRNRGNPSR